MKSLEKLLFRNVKRYVDVEFIVILDFKERLVNAVLTNVIMKFEEYWIEFKIFIEFFCIDGFIFGMKNKI